MVNILGFHLKPPILYDPDEDKWQALWRCSLAEFFGTAIFIFLGCGSVFSAFEFSRHTDGNLDSFIVLVAMGHGFAITVVIYTIGDVSGGNINPAITWALVLTRKMSLLRGGLYWIAQISGAVCGALLLKSMIPPAMLQTGVISEMLGCHGLHHDMDPLQGFWFEIVLTFIFVFVVFGTAISPFVGKMAPVSGGGDEYGHGKLTPLALGLTILVLHLVAVPFTGASMNPARSFGPALIGSCWDNHWVYWAGPLVGSTVSALVAHTLFLSNPSDIAMSFAIIRGDQSLAKLSDKKKGMSPSSTPAENYSQVNEEVELEQ